MPRRSIAPCDLLHSQNIDTGNLELGEVTGSSLMDQQPADESVTGSAQDVPDATDDLDGYLANTERTVIEAALQAHRPNRTATAQFTAHHPAESSIPAEETGDRRLIAVSPGAGSPLGNQTRAAQAICHHRPVLTQRAHREREVAAAQAPLIPTQLAGDRS